MVGIWDHFVLCRKTRRLSESPRELLVEAETEENQSLTATFYERNVQWTSNDSCG